MRGLAILAVPLVLAACDSREVVSICAERGDPAGAVTAAFHAADGSWAVLASDGEAGAATLSLGMFGEPALPRLWRLAENTMRVLPEVEPSPCGDLPLMAVRVVFDDGSVIYRQTTCTGNALSRAATALLDAAGTDGATEPDARGPVARLGEACERLS
ncbi:hypothetical protein N8I71_12250 [Roseibacterium sp. SDUM158016]|uniref:hypothetical protein n=1 Tax=Roseicyclus sediminis TaxID=2980997 RepID=UPI0021CF4DFE|nr:hypothetical protein [Roseibacterium sp. SDUM158016]MCU4653607.1 hypothetical protein [Roseibacterium sp. SDUM158016]